MTAISVFEDGAFVRREAVAAGQIGKLWGLAGVRIGDAIGEAHGANGRAFSPPTLETVVVPGDGEPTGARCASRSTSSPSRTR